VPYVRGGYTRGRMDDLTGGTRMKPIVRSSLKVLTALLTMSWTLLMAATWFTALANGDTVNIRINHYGERDIELIMMIIFIPLTMVGTYLIVKDEIPEKE